MYDPGLGPFAVEHQIMELTDFNGLSLSCRRMFLKGLLQLFTEHHNCNLFASKGKKMICMCT